MVQRRRVVSCLAGVTLVGLLAACGGSSSGPTSTPTPAPTPTPCTQSVLYQVSGPVESLTLAFDDFSVPESGRLDVTMDWTNASSPIGFYLVPANTCGNVDDFNARNCNFIISSETTTKPRKISRDITAGNYRWLIGNFASGDESVSLQIVLSKGGCAPLVDRPGAAASTRQAWPALEGSRRR